MLAIFSSTLFLFSFQEEILRIFVITQLLYTYFSFVSPIRRAWNGGKKQGNAPCLEQSANTPNLCCNSPLSATADITNTSLYWFLLNYSLTQTLSTNTSSRKPLPGSVSAEEINFFFFTSAQVGHLT